MRKISSITWRLLIAVTMIFSLATTLSLQAAMPAVAGATSCIATVPTLMTPSDGAILQSTTPRFTWSAATNANQYRLYCAPWPQAPWDGDIASETNLLGVVTSNNALNWQQGLDPLDSCTKYNWQVVAVNNAAQCGTSSAIWKFTTVPDMVGAVTGWTWEFPYTTVDDFFDIAHPYNTNDRTSIMVVFDGCSDAASLTKLNFKVTYNISVAGKITPVANEVPLSAVHHTWYAEPIYCEDQGNQQYDLVFLTVAKPMATNTKPTVYLMNGATVIAQAVADDGIAPMLELSTTGSPYAGGEVKITVTSSEPLWEASMAVNKNGLWDWNPDIPTVNLFPALVESPDEYGGYCTWFRDIDEEYYTDLKWMQINGNTATKTFTMEAQSPQDSYFVEVYAHDMTWCNFDWDCDQYWWRHEKWSSASQFFTGTDVIELHLVEGWNLISFPRTPANPTLKGVFGDGVVNKVYTYKAGKWSGAIYNIHSGLWTAPAGMTLLTSLQGGVGYWVYCSAAGEQQEFYSEFLESLAEIYSDDSEKDLDVDVVWTDLLVELAPAAVGPAALPTYPLTAGWNLVGVPVQGSMDQYQIRFDSWFWMPDFLKNQLFHAPVTMASDFLTGLDWNAIYWYLPPVTVWNDTGFIDETYTFPSGYQVATPGTTNSFNWKLAFWLATMGSGISIFPQTVPDWVIPEDSSEGFSGDYVNEGYYDDYDSICDDDHFSIYFEGYTDSGMEVYFHMGGDIDYDTGEAYDTYICDECSYIETEAGYDYFISGTITVDDIEWGDGDIELWCSFSGVTENGLTVEGTFYAYFYYNSYDDYDCYYEYYYLDEIDFEGTITGGETSIGNFVIDSAIMENIAPVVIPGYGYWVWLNAPGTQLPAPATFSGAGITIGGTEVQ